jgi:hypothetical protein
MQATLYSDINILLDILLSRMQAILGKKLVGLYLDGSLVIGDFDPYISDIDLVAALSADIDDREFEELHKMHTDFANEHKEWDDRIEVCYISLAALIAVRSRTSTIVKINPGEPFHRRESSKEWLLSWYLVREKSVTLFGPPAKTIIEPISKEEFIQSVKDHTKSWGEWIHEMHTRKGQAYAVLTMCRALYVCEKGEQVSKKQAAIWAQKELPEWSQLIQNALAWREAWRDDDVDHEVTYPETVEFVMFVRDQIERKER